VSDIDVAVRVRATTGTVCGYNADVAMQIYDDL
jgi:hypothetical protein